MVQEIKIGNSKIIKNENKVILESPLIIIKSLIRANININLKTNINYLNKYNNEDIIRIDLHVKKVTKLTEYLKENNYKFDYDKTVLFLQNIGKQLLELTNHYKMGVSFFSLEDFVVLDDEVFLFLNDEKCFEYDNDKGIYIMDIPLEVDKNHSFFPPEMEDFEEIPKMVYYTSGYYSLAQCCLYLFVNVKIDYVKVTKEKFDEITGPFLFTPLYWVLYRCINVKPHKRILILE